MKYAGRKRLFLLFICSFLFCGITWPQFHDDFEKPSDAAAGRAPERWEFFTGDGMAAMAFVLGDGFASILVDATQDRENIWWALIKTCVPGIWT